MEKAKKTLTPEKLEKLKVAREKALLVRQENAKNKALEKELVNVEKEKHITEVKEKLAKVKEKPIIEEEPEVIIKKTKAKPKKKKIVIVEDSDTDEEEQHQVIYVKRKKDVKLPEPHLHPPPEQEVKPVQVFQRRQQVIEQQNDDPYQRHYEAIFNQRARY